jgi:hypothetical protein
MLAVPEQTGVATFVMEADVSPADHHRRRLWRRLLPALAVFALAVRILVPQGFMVAPHETPGAFPLVICTSQGAVDLGATGGHAPDGKAAGHHAPCVFAGHAAAPAPGLLAVARAVYAVHQPITSASVRRDLAPGRGLSAPPLPARGPPARLI